MSITAEAQMKISFIRQKVVDGSVTLDELREAIQIMRADRRTAVTSSAAKRSRAKAAIPDAASLLDELGNI